MSQGLTLCSRKFVNDVQRTLQGDIAGPGMQPLCSPYAQTNELTTLQWMIACQTT